MVNKLQKKQRILVITPYFPCLSHTFVTEQVIALKRNGFDVKVLAREERNEELWDYINTQGITYEDVIYDSFYSQSPFVWKPRYWSNRVTQAVKDTLTSYGIQFNLKRRNFFGRLLCDSFIQTCDLIHVHWNQQLFEVGLPLARALDKSVVVVANDRTCLDYFKDERYVEKINQQVKKCIMVSDWCQNAWIESGIKKDKLERVYWGINLKKFSDSPPQRRTRDKLKIITIGRLAPQKRHWDLIEMCASLKEKGYQFQLSVVGGGELQTKINELISEKSLHECVKMLGPLSNSEVIKQLAQHDLFVLSSEWETFGLVTAEAMASYLPTIVSNGGASPELVDAGITGDIFPVGDVETLVSKVEWFQSLSENDKNAMAKASRERCEEYFSMEQHIAGVIKAWALS